MWIKASKTDPFRQGVTVYPGMTEGMVCPVAALLSYIMRRGVLLGPLDLFLFEDGKSLTQDCFIGAVRRDPLFHGTDRTKSTHYFTERTGPWIM